jgi:hypothetical protein
MRPIHAISFAIAALTAGAALTTPTVRAQHVEQTAGVSNPKPAQRISSKSDGRAPPIAKTAKHESQSLRYLVSDAP